MSFKETNDSKSMSKLKINLILLNCFIIIIIFALIYVSVTYFYANLPQVGEFIGTTFIITLFIWFLTLLIPKKYKLYKILSSGTFILCIFLAFSIHFLIQHIVH